MGVPRVLSIAGSDSGGGAGIQADLKAFARCGVHGMTAITAITWQNTVAVEGMTPVPPDAIIGQVKAVAEDIGIDAVKIGMLGTVDTIEAVAAALDLIADAPVVLDPVMVAESGASLLEPEAQQALVGLMKRATVVTPNLDEARALVGEEADLARAVHELGSSYVVITGGHAEGDAVIDLFFDGTHMIEIRGERFPSGASHGSGCTHSSALAAQLALGKDPLEAARVAQRIAADAVRDGLRGIGAGSGPVNVLGI
jgi:hydroxymethylpyrimidine/phosphomethylpyrimidine kinase